MRGIWRYLVQAIGLGSILLLIIYTIDQKSYTFKFNQKSNKAINYVKENVTCNETTHLWNQTLDFDQLDFSNVTGNPAECYVVPNIIHFLHFGGTPMSYIHMICVLAAFKNQKPDKIYFHSDNNTAFTGKYWEIIKNTPQLKDIIEFRDINLPYTIFGQPLSKEWRKWHGSDIMRMRTLMKYGGIFLDNDCYVISNLDNYRKFEITMNWDEGQFLASQVVIAHKDARFLRKWLNTYKVYDGSRWYYNAGERPTVEVLYKQPELIHRVKVLFGADTGTVFFAFQRNEPHWKNMYQIVHLFSRHMYQLQNVSEKAKYPVEFNETNIAYYPVTFRDMAYDVYDIANIKWPKDKL